MNSALPLIVLNIVIRGLIDISISPCICDCGPLFSPLPLFFSPHEGEKHAVALNACALSNSLILFKFCCALGEDRLWPCAVNSALKLNGNTLLDGYIFS